MIHGEYSAESYTVYSDHEPIYTAGNAPFDSQHYVEASRGVGLRKMRSFCVITARELAKEHNDTYGGVKRMEDGNVDTMQRRTPCGRVPACHVP